ncbi:MAG: acireductone synthase [Pseudomonadota bacterium]|nr:acireductone synthase [Pseudomonadota bacterium]
MTTQAILTDIEGTTSSISFVRDVLFPYARQALPTFVQTRGSDPAVRKWLDMVATENGAVCNDAILAEVLQGWIDQDRKHTALKALQGIIWADGYRRGDFTAHMYPDATRALRDWHGAGMPLYVYSSGSVPAQRLFFGYSDDGDLTGLVSGWFDTQTGGKREAASYARIAESIGLPAPAIVFLSDVVEELDAARDAGMDTVLVDRIQDYPLPRLGEVTHGHARVETFAQVALHD